MFNRSNNISNNNSRLVNNISNNNSKLEKKLEHFKANRSQSP